MPPGNNEIQLAIEVFTTEDPAVRIRKMAKEFIETQKWISSELFYDDQKEELEEEDKAQWYSFMFALGLDHIGEGGDIWFSDVEKLLEFSRPLADLSSRDSGITLHFRSVPYMSETIEFFSESPKNWDMAGMIRTLASAYKGKYANSFGGYGESHLLPKSLPALWKSLVMLFHRKRR